VKAMTMIKVKDREIRDGMNGREKQCEDREEAEWKAGGRRA